MIHDQTIARMKARVQLTLTDSCLIEAESSARGSVGEVVHSWETVAADVACRVITPSASTRGSMQAVGAQESMIDAYRLICPVGTALAVDQRVTINGSVFQIVGIRDGLTDGVDVQAYMTRVR